MRQSERQRDVREDAGRVRQNRCSRRGCNFSQGLLVAHDSVLRVKAHQGSIRHARRTASVTKFEQDNKSTRAVDTLFSQV